VLVISAMSYLFLQPYEAVLIPLAAIDELGQHRSRVDYLAAVGAIWLASLREMRSPNLPMVGLIATGGASLIGIALAPHLAMVSVCVFFATACVCCASQGSERSSTLGRWLSHSILNA